MAVDKSSKREVYVHEGIRMVAENFGSGAQLLKIYFFMVCC